MQHTRVTCFNSFMERLYLKYRFPNRDLLFHISCWDKISVSENPVRFGSGVLVDPLGRASALVSRFFRADREKGMKEYQAYSEVLDIDSFWKYMSMPLSELSTYWSEEKKPVGKMVSLWVRERYEEVP
jgi:hypothetical protein